MADAVNTNTRETRRNIASIQTFFDGLLRGSVSNNIFFDVLPKGLKDNWTDLVVVRMPGSVADRDAYFKGNVLISLYAKANAYGTKDVKTLQALEKKLDSAISSNTSQYYKLARKGAYSDYDSQNGVYYHVVQLNLIIT